jgi:hypothetical protein
VRSFIEHEEEPSCLGINADIRIDPDRPMTADESGSYHERQLQAAAKLGFPEFFHFDDHAPLSLQSTRSDLVSREVRGSSGKGHVGQ